MTMTNSKTWCGQQVYGGCAGEGCERDCSCNAFTPAEQIVAENARASRMELLLLTAAITVIAIAGLVSGSYALDRQAQAYIDGRN